MNQKWFQSIAGITVAAALLFASADANATPITGEIHFTGLFAPIDSGGLSTTLDSATGISFSDPTYVLAASGTFSTYVTPWITTASFVSAFNFNPLTPNPVALWTAGGFTFTLTGVQIIYQSDTQLNLLGTGFLTGNGLDQTVGSWSFQGGGSAFFTFRANDTAEFIAPLSDGGDTLLLLGSVLLVIAVTRRVLQAKAPGFARVQVRH